MDNCWKRNLAAPRCLIKFILLLFVLLVMIIYTGIMLSCIKDLLSITCNIRRVSSLYVHVQFSPLSDCVESLKLIQTHFIHLVWLWDFRGSINSYCKVICV